MCKIFGFCDKWIAWIKECIESAHADVLVNGSPSGDFRLGRGLRQGDPISPFLFIIAAEGIGLLLKKAIRLGLFDPIEIGPRKVVVSHIQFADDTIFLGKVSLRNAIFLKRFLVVLEAASGLRINKEKCQVIPIRAEAGITEDIAKILGCKKESKPFKYLGVNVGCHHRFAKDWKYVIEKVKNRLAKWSNLKISLGGRITLVKSVLSALPTYALSVFKAPKIVIKKLIALQQSFLWGGGLCDKKIVWAKWESLFRPKSFGGLGVRDLESFNKALMGKWVWRVLEGGEALWIDITRGSLRQDRRGWGGIDLLCADMKSGGWWGDVLKCLSDERGDWFLRSVVKRVGNGEKTAFWDELWVGNEKLRVTFPRLYRISRNKECSVAMAGRWVGDEWVWGQGWRRDFRACEVDSLNNLVDLLKCRKTVVNEPDRWIWEPEASGIYSVKSGYSKIQERKLELTNGANKPFILLWNNWAAPKAQATAWRVISRRIATKTELRKRGAIPLNSDLKCPLCGSAEESIDHLFVECCKVWELWSSCLNWIGVQASLVNRVQNNLLHFCGLAKGKRNRVLLAAVWSCTIWLIWRKRNEVVFCNGEWNSEKLLGEIKSFLWNWAVGKRKAGEERKDFSSWCVNPLL